MKKLLSCLIKCFKDLVEFNFTMNLMFYYYAQFKVGQKDKKKLYNMYKQIECLPNLEEIK